MNLTEANLRGPEQDPVWSELYQAKEEYGLTDLSPSSIESLIQNMLKDEALFQRYFRYGCPSRMWVSVILNRFLL